MSAIFILLFPVFEIVLTFALFRQFGFANTFFAWLLFTILGIGLLRTTGVRLAVSVAQSMRLGKSPGLAALDAALVGLAGVLFVVPGFTSDALALILFVPWFRRFFARRLIAKVQAGPMRFSFFGSHNVGSHNVASHHSDPNRTSQVREAASEDVIDVEAVRVQAVRAQAVRSQAVENGLATSQEPNLEKEGSKK
jgi:UPF0716 protein FxsA